MKEGWEYKKLGEVCDFEGGSQPPKSEWINHPQDGYVRMLQIRDFTKSRNAEIEYVKITKKLRLCKADDILIGRYGASVGKILTGLAGAYNVAIIKSIPDENIVRKEFIRRYFESPLFQNILFKVCSSRAAQAGFSKDDIKDSFMNLNNIVSKDNRVKGHRHDQTALSFLAWKYKLNIHYLELKDVCAVNSETLKHKYSKAISFDVEIVQNRDIKTKVFFDNYDKFGNTKGFNKFCFICLSFVDTVRRRLFYITKR